MEGYWLAQKQQVRPALALGAGVGWSLERTHIAACVPVTATCDSPLSEHTDGFPCAWEATDEGLIQAVQCIRKVCGREACQCHQIRRSEHSFSCSTKNSCKARFDGLLH